MIYNAYYNYQIGRIQCNKSVSKSGSVVRVFIGSSSTDAGNPKMKKQQKLFNENQNEVDDTSSLKWHPMVAPPCGRKHIFIFTVE
jgi:hypothetical protein